MHSAGALCTIVSTFHLHARLFRGTLDAPITNELQSEESDDLGELEALAEELAHRGFGVWLYEHAPRTALPHASDYRVVAEWKGTGERVR